MVECYFGCQEQMSLPANNTNAPPRKDKEEEAEGSKEGREGGKKHMYTSIPRNIMAQVRYRPWRGSAAHIMFLASKAWWVSSAQDIALYCWDPREVWREGGRKG